MTRAGQELRLKQSVCLLQTRFLPDFQSLIRKIQLLWVLKILNISTYSLEQNLDFFRKLKENYPAKVIIASIMGSNEDEWTKLASLCEKAGADGLAAINTIKSIMNVDLNGFSTSPNVSGKSLANVPTTFSEMNQMYSACLLMPTMMTAWQKYAHEFMFRTKEQRI